MPKDPTTTSFLSICQMPKKDRMEKLSLDLAINISKKDENSIEQILAFVKYIDDNFERYDPKSKIPSILGEMLYSHIPSDIRALTILALKKQNYQLNIVLRHLIEIFVISLWSDLISNFSDAFDYLIRDKDWKPYRSNQRVSWEIKNSQFPNRSLRDRLERIRMLNFAKKKGKNFYKHYFSKCSECDLYVLFQLPICKACIEDFKEKNKKIKIRKFHLDASVLKKGKEDTHAHFKTDFGLECSYCGKSKENRAHTRGIPEAQDMLEMMSVILPNSLLINISTLRKLYSYLSEEFVHYSTKVDPDRKPQKKKLNNYNLALWDLQAIVFLIDLMHPVLMFYFRKLRNKA